MCRELNYDPVTGIFVWEDGEVAGHRAKADGYRRIEYQGKKFLAHRLAWFFIYGEWPKDVIDHIDGNRDNNQITNLRSVTQSQNLYNMKKIRNSFGLLGVQKGRYGKYRARIRVNKKEIHLGEFNTPEEAHEVYMEAKRKFHETSEQ